VGGDDEIIGAGGVDYVEGGLGNDTVSGDAGCGALAGALAASVSKHSHASRSWRSSGFNVIPASAAPSASSEALPSSAVDTRGPTARPDQPVDNSPELLTTCPRSSKK
jgi:Ca2+-binding RTX toxin-like protein